MDVLGFLKNRIYYDSLIHCIFNFLISLFRFYGGKTSISKNQVTESQTTFRKSTRYKNPRHRFEENVITKSGLFQNTDTEHQSSIVRSPQYSYSLHDDSKNGFWKHPDPGI